MQNNLLQVTNDSRKQNSSSLETSNIIHFRGIILKKSFLLLLISGNVYTDSLYRVLCGRWDQLVTPDPVFAFGRSRSVKCGRKANNIAIAQYSFPHHLTTISRSSNKKYANYTRCHKVTPPGSKQYYVDVKFNCLLFPSQNYYEEGTDIS